MTEPRIGWFCTGRGSHAEVIPDGIAFVKARPAGQNGTMPVVLTCPVCKEPKRLGWKARQKIEEAGLAEVDISALPC